MTRSVSKYINRGTRTAVRRFPGMSAAVLTGQTTNTLIKIRLIETAAQIRRHHTLEPQERQNGEKV